MYAPRADLRKGAPRPRYCCCYYYYDNDDDCHYDDVVVVGYFIVSVLGIFPWRLWVDALEES